MSEEYKSLNPKCKLAMYIVYSILFAILFAVVFVIGYFLTEDYSNPYWIISGMILAVILAYMIVAPQVFFRRYRYILTSDKIDVLRGIIIVRRTVVPIERIHQVEVTRGPINNLLKLADVDITTAGGVASIQFLDIPVANNIAEELNKYINDIIRDRKKDD
jgi:Uncharacterized conserved protein